MLLKCQTDKRNWHKWNCFCAISQYTLASQSSFLTKFIFLAMLDACMYTYIDMIPIDLLFHNWWDFPPFFSLSFLLSSNSGNLCYLAICDLNYNKKCNCRTEKAMWKSKYFLWKKTVTNFLYIKYFNIYMTWIFNFR